MQGPTSVHNRCLLRRLSYAKGCFPTIVMCEMGVITAGNNAILNLEALHSLRYDISNFAEILWLVDDMVDLFEDAAMRRYNIFLDSIDYACYPDAIPYQEIAHRGTLEIDKRLLPLKESDKIDQVYLLARCLIKSWMY